MASIASTATEFLSGEFYNGLYYQSKLRKICDNLFWNYYFIYAKLVPKCNYHIMEILYYKVTPYKATNVLKNVGLSFLQALATA